MNKKSKTILLFVAFALFIVIAVFAYDTLSKKISPQSNINVIQNEGEVTQNSQNEEKEKIEAPDFTVLDIDGTPIKLSDLFGKPIVLNFWASWCSPCKSEMPEFNEVYKDLGEDITFVMVNLVDGQRETKETGTQYITEQGFSFPVYFDTEQEAANAYGIRSIPTTVFIDKDGYIVTGAQGTIDAETLKKGIDLIK
ncbi:TlpA disulfide reductase family protein [Clostridium sp. FS41]|uniref:TlpA family protein disulfide reductase n=1 Tax=Clostridia TaxID=186801 RepID=UPI0005D385EA|nr:TlpA disulfide reductase family protein [Clostridium sp. FS41]KJJ68622.1 thiol-disulfide oxidoreductase ResA [Clostridium sp. FS41]